MPELWVVVSISTIKKTIYKNVIYTKKERNRAEEKKRIVWFLHFVLYTHFSLKVFICFLVFVFFYNMVYLLVRMLEKHKYWH